ncbi:tRNA (cytidine(34)-2'-O)-methyltransferase [Solemya velesiana gill symbiont]|uniref:tRNA (cytidine(34)-2'-O)-methyltransferase n=1 Tax=Solemya velesiana gill symbiont TaxID=1918948 RepID=A0A1T2KWH6_9GAMM|nr:tRNA (cytidine(34)-2'-O)-methyltransferase [Solemya velesiana gill symbiont]OOZ37174.1 tRNA (uridine(34)/cytosine(34)/5-carboxymethylaminomethyluridine(34)-2'-O)-methyltransferase TrmL [Solemya velesiana gill symbiont]
MFHVALYEPEIPPNTGNIIRLCANTGSTLHLIHPLGFSLDEKQVRRAGLDYHDMACVTEHVDYAAFGKTLPSSRILACSTRGKVNYAEVEYQPGDVLLFGPETRGLPQQQLDALPDEQLLRIPMVPGNRSLNLSNAVAVILYEAWRQQGFSGS